MCKLFETVNLDIICGEVHFASTLNVITPKHLLALDLFDLPPPLDLWLFLHSGLSWDTQ